MTIRDEIYHHNSSEFGELINYKSPYTLVKAVYYMETASIFLFLTQAFIRSPNFITMLYVIAGVVGAFLLITEQNTLFNVGLFLVFTKGTFDWADGPLARRLNKTSFIGHSLDTYGAQVNDSAFRLSFIYYTLVYYPNLMFLFPVIAFIILITKFSVFSDILYYKAKNNITLDNVRKIRDTEVEESLKDPKNIKGIANLYYHYQSILDARARSIDFLLLILLVDKIFDYDLSKLLLSLSMLIVLRSLVKYVADFYYAFNVYKEGTNG